MSHLERCDSCGQCLPPEQLISFGEQFLCQDCFSSATVLCARCGERIWRDGKLLESVAELEAEE